MAEIARESGAPFGRSRPRLGRARPKVGRTEPRLPAFGPNLAESWRALAEYFYLAQTLCRNRRNGRSMGDVGRRRRKFGPCRAECCMQSWPELDRCRPGQNVGEIWTEFGGRGCPVLVGIHRNLGARRSSLIKLRPSLVHPAPLFEGKPKSHPDRAAGVWPAKSVPLRATRLGEAKANWQPRARTEGGVWNRR